jgi:hypothetical protein
MADRFRTRQVAAIAVLLALFALPTASATAKAPTQDDVYALANGCVQLRAATPGKTAADAGPFRMQASDLGSFLLYGKDGTFLAADPGTGTVGRVATPSPRSDWRVRPQGEAFILTPASGRALAVDSGGRLVLADAPDAFTFPAAGGCATYPDSDTDVDGAPTRGGSAYGRTSGLLESHLHWMAFEIFGGNAHCGRPWSPYGVAFAMVDCPDHQPGGFGLAFENILSGKSPAATHDTAGWPTFRDWPSPTSLTHEGTYFRWVERAYRGGLRVMVNLFVDSTGLCNLQPTKAHDCNEMNTVRLEIAQLLKLQDYVDAQFGGPGKGWLRVVKDPFEARKVVNDGKLAVVMGVEVSRLFDCRILSGVSECTRESVRRDLDALQRAGVRSLEIAVKTDTALSGAAGDPGTNGIVTNISNRQETGRFFDMRTCTGDPQAADKTQLTFGPGFAGPGSEIVRLLDPGGATPVYPPPPHCNTVGLSAIGRDLIAQIMDKGMLVDPDHMSQAARQSALDLLEARRYSGVISSHSWSTPVDEPRIMRLGGMVIPKASAIAQASDSSWFTGEYRRLRKLRDPRFVYGFGFGSDMNGVAKQPVARTDAATNAPVTYPFKSLDGRQTIRQATTGKRTWDFNKDGVAQYGLYLDWLEELRRRADPTFAADMLRGSEADLQMWERATGVPAMRPLAARSRLTAKGLGRVGLGASAQALLRSAGQPPVRGPRVWRWAVSRRAPLAAGRVAMVLDASGRSAYVASTAPGHTALGVGPGDRVTAALRRAARAVSGAPSLRVRTAGPRARFVYVVRRGRVVGVGVATATASRTPGALRALVQAAGLTR